MRLKTVFISEYKNLVDFTVSFEENDIVDVFVGRNGSGKSNFIEALIEIFNHLYEFSKSVESTMFNYKIFYEVDGDEISVSYTSGTMLVNEKEVSTLKKVPMPDHVLVYYSGHNERVEQLMHDYEVKFSNKLKRADVDSSRRFIGVGNNYKDLLLSVLLIQPSGNKSREFLLDKLLIGGVEDEFVLRLKRPNYAVSQYGKRNVKFDIETNDAKGRYWRPEGVTKSFLDSLSLCIKKAEGDTLRTEGYLWEEDVYQLYISIPKVQEIFKGLSAEQLFKQFDNLKTLGMLESIKVPIVLNNGRTSSVSELSDGQLQSVYIYAISELFKDSNCLTLMDEPDSFLHPEWQFQCLDLVKEVSKEAANTNHILISSHSAITLIQYDSERVRYFDVKEGKAVSYLLPKRIAVQKLSSDIIKYSEKEQLLSIINAIQIKSMPVLFTEGSTDPVILKEAWYKLYDEEIPFIPFYAFSCTYMDQLIKDDRIHNEMGGLPIFALFDFDKAFNSWNGLRGNVIETDPYKGLVKKWEIGESYAIMIPIPENAEIRRQSIKCENPLQTYQDDSHCEIEHLLYGYPATADFFHKTAVAGGEIISFKSDGSKTSFATQVVPTLNKECFESFRPLFEFIKLKCEEHKNAMAA